LFRQAAFEASREEKERKREGLTYMVHTKV
jgi:hypothetical protein